MYQMVHSISVRGRTSASAETVYALLRDGASWPRWSPLGSFELVREGAVEPEGLGALRLFRTNGFSSYEEIVALEPGRRFGYALDHGLPLRDYVAYVDLAPAGDGTVADCGRSATHGERKRGSVVAAAMAARVPGSGVSVGGSWAMTGATRSTMKKAGMVGRDI